MTYTARPFGFQFVDDIQTTPTAGYEEDYPVNDDVAVFADGDWVIGGLARVSWAELGEGWSGEYDADDPEDTELLRFDVSRWDPDIGDYTPVDDGSYCTQVPVSATPEQRRRCLEIILDEVREPVSLSQSIKKICERLSWISLKWLDGDMTPRWEGPVRLYLEM